MGGGAALEAGTATVAAAAAVAAAASSGAAGTDFSNAAGAEDRNVRPATEQGRKGTCVIAKQGRQEEAEQNSADHHVPPGEAAPAAYDFIAGCAAGVASTATGHPFDTVKIRVQMSTGPADSTPLSCLKKLVRTEGSAALFKGIASPMVTIPLVNAVVFGAVRAPPHIAQPSTHTQTDRHTHTHTEHRQAHTDKHTHTQSTDKHTQAHTHSTHTAQTAHTRSTAKHTHRAHTQHRQHTHTQHSQAHTHSTHKHKHTVHTQHRQHTQAHTHSTHTAHTAHTHSTHQHTHTAHTQHIQHTHTAHTAHTHTMRSWLFGRHSTRTHADSRPGGRDNRASQISPTPERAPSLPSYIDHSVAIEIMQSRYRYVLQSRCSRERRSLFSVRPGQERAAGPARPDLWQPDRPRYVELFKVVNLRVLSRRRGGEAGERGRRDSGVETHG